MPRGRKQLRPLAKLPLGYTRFNETGLAPRRMAQRMKPRSGLRTGCDAFCFFSKSAMAAESVRGFTMVSVGASATTSESLQLWTADPNRVAQPERRSLEGPPAAFVMHWGDEVAFVPTHWASSRIAGRRETEYISAANDETATASSSSAISNSPITNPRRPHLPGRRSASTSIPPSCRPTCCGV